MIIAVFVISLCFIQVLLYWLADKFMLPLKLTILIVLVLAYVFVFPKYFYNDYISPGILQQLLKNIMLHHILLFAGILSTLFIHIIYSIAKMPKRPGA